MTQVQLNAHRNEIDRIDREIIALISARTRVVKKLMVLKTDEESIRSCDRVQQVLDKVSKLAEENGLEPEIAVPTYQTLIKVLTDMQLKYFRSDKLSKTTEV
ncbi:chorismate mutase [Paenibacillus zanthoxyli]|uniref:chorismate mutase n=1 Tax=Paenibacillus zanthoxyli TaxID=369399 RepID=UPI00046E5696|nr:chorismate mutase [Paenibacillus zanthoxyli]